MFKRSLSVVICSQNPKTQMEALQQLRGYTILIVPNHEQMMKKLEEFKPEIILVDRFFKEEDMGDHAYSLGGIVSDMGVRFIGIMNEGDFTYDPTNIDSLTIQEMGQRRFCLDGLAKELVWDFESMLEYATKQYSNT